MEEKEINTLERIEQTFKGVYTLSWGGNHLYWFDFLLPQTKNKLIIMSYYAVQNNIGNQQLAIDILGAVKLEDIYISSKQRRMLATNLEQSLKMIKDIEDGKQCKDELSKYIRFERTLGSGLFGQVYTGSLISDPRFNFAVKMARQTRDNLSPEYHIGNLLNQLVFNNIAQNVPVMVDSYNCERCTFDAKTVKFPTAKCIFSISEIATGGDMVYWLSKRQSEIFLYNALFQIMAGIHAIQSHYGIVNTDIKAQNILIYKVNHGGCWKYTIHGRDFYVPNYGKLFIVADFGIAKVFYPQFKYDKEYRRDGYTSLGDRAFMINNGQFEPLNNPFVWPSKIQRYQSNVVRWDDGSVTNVNRILLNERTNQIIYNPTLTQTQKERIGFDSNDLNFYNSNLVPPLEFAIDTQDVLRMFTGGKKMVHDSYHKGHKFSEPFVSSLKRYELTSDYDHFLSSNEIKSTDLSKLLAGHFIVDFFTNVYNDYTVPPFSSDWIISHINTS